MYTAHYIYYLEEHIRFKLYYCCIVYGSGRPNNELNVIDNQGLRLCSSAFKTFTIESIKVKSGEQLFQARQLKPIFFTKPSRIYVSNKVKMFRHMICCAFTFLKTTLVFTKA